MKIFLLGIAWPPSKANTAPPNFTHRPKNLTNNPTCQQKEIENLNYAKTKLLSFPLWIFIAGLFDPDVDHLTIGRLFPIEGHVAAAVKFAFIDNAHAL